MLRRMAGVHSGMMLLVGTMLLAGCGGETRLLYDVSGQVTFDGGPLKEGRISFRMLEGDGRSFSGEIKEGAYALQTETGEMAVEILASRLIPGKFDYSNGVPEPVGEMYIPAKYNTKTELAATITPDGDNRFAFTLTAR